MFVGGPQLNLREPVLPAYFSMLWQVHVIEILGRRIRLDSSQGRRLRNRFERSLLVHLYWPCLIVLFLAESRRVDILDALYGKFSALQPLARRK